MCSSELGKKSKKEKKKITQLHGRWKCFKVGGASSGRGHGERVEREPITGVWGRSPQRGPWAEPVEIRGAKPPEAEGFLVLERPTERQNLSRCQFLAKCSIGTWYKFTPKI